MSRALNKERIVFLVGTALFLWVMVKLAVFWSRPDSRAGTAKVVTGTLEAGDQEIRDRLAIDDLDSYRNRGKRNPFFPDATQPARFYARCVVRHSFTTSGVLSRYNFECRMIPRPVSEIRFKIPPNTNVSRIYSHELDTQRIHGSQGNIYVVPVKPKCIKRTYYRCQVLLVTRKSLKLPTKWTTPVISCTGATPNVVSESGEIALVALGRTVELIPTTEDPARTHLTPIREAQWPKELATRGTKAVYHFAKPIYSLPVRVQRTTIARTTKPVKPPVKPTKPPTAKPTKPPIVKPTKPPGEEDPDKLALPPPPERGPPLKLQAIVLIEQPEPRRQAVLRHQESKEFFRKFEGDRILGTYVVARITDNLVVLEDIKKKKRFYYRGRFEDEYKE